MKKKKKCYLACGASKRGVYKSRIERLYDNAIFLDSPEEAELLLLPTEKLGLSEEQKDLIEKYGGVLEVSAFPSELLFEGNEKFLEEYFSEGQEIELAKEDVSCELEM